MKIGSSNGIASLGPWMTHAFFQLNIVFLLMNVQMTFPSCRSLFDMSSHRLIGHVFQVTLMPILTRIQVFMHKRILLCYLLQMFLVPQIMMLKTPLLRLLTRCKPFSFSILMILLFMDTLIGLIISAWWMMQLDCCRSTLTVWLHSMRSRSPLRMFHKR